MTDAIRVAAIDDHPIFLDGLDWVLRRMKDVVLVAKGTCAADALSIAAEHQPDIMLLDIAIPGDGIAAARAIKVSQPSIRIINLAASDDYEKFAAALASGAQGYLLKGVAAAELLQAIKAVHGGEPYITPAVSARFLMQRYQEQKTAAVPPSTLNAREAEILELVTEGLSNQEIAERLGLVPSTIKYYLSRIFDELGVRSRTQAIAAWKRDAK